MSGISALLSLVTLVVVALLNSKVEKNSWLRQERLACAVNLKLTVSVLRKNCQDYIRNPNDSAAIHGLFDFADVNSAMAALDLIGPTAIASDISALREELREFVAVTSSYSDIESDAEQRWKASRLLVDARVDSILSLVRAAIV